MTRTAGAPIGCQRPSRFWGLGCPKIYHETEDTLGHHSRAGTDSGRYYRGGNRIEHPAVAGCHCHQW
ncbi:hypothetical protein [Thiolapillus sp.]|uniref:hypothetical protein n=1 Tax=Thiolapillus sp. TaxID=2017437 RepID=UPI003AF60857